MSTRNKSECTALDLIVRTALASFFDDFCRVDWYGRERDAVNLFVFGHLLTGVAPGSILSDPAQLGIEMPVPQVVEGKRFKGKKYVCKDVVIWPRPKMTVGNTYKQERIYPLSVMEWKSINRHDGKREIDRKLAEYLFDIEWLKSTSKGKEDFTGYAVLIRQDGSSRTLNCSRIRSGQSIANWIDESRSIKIESKAAASSS